MTSAATNAAKKTMQSYRLGLNILSLLYLAIE